MNGTRTRGGGDGKRERMGRKGRRGEVENGEEGKEGGGREGGGREGVEKGEGGKEGEVEKGEGGGEGEGGGIACLFKILLHCELIVFNEFVPLSGGNVVLSNKCW